MKNVYLDYNIYIHLLKGTIDKEKLKEYLRIGMAQYIYSPAHIEEVYLAGVFSEDELYADKVLNIVEEISKCKEVKPNLSGELQIINERPSDCYKTVKKYDTTKIVDKDSHQKYYEDKARFDSLVKIDKHNQSISTIAPSEIWTNNVVNKRIEQLNFDREKIINQFNNRPDVQILLLMGVD